MALSSKDALQEIFEDLMSRFIINVPQSEIETTDRICFQIEQAHWFYEDFIRETHKNLPHFTLKKFAAEMFSRCPLLKDFIQNQNVEEIYKKFISYKLNVPIAGAILLNEKMDKVLLVRGWGQRTSWTFPKGKINQNETEMQSAIREVFEETGFDISSYIKENDYIECLIRNEQRNRLYIVHGVSEQTPFCPQTRKEIGDIKWHRLLDLPGYQFNNGKRNSPADFDTKFYMIRSFISELQSWIQKKKKVNQKKNLKASQSVPDHLLAVNNSESSNILKNMLGINFPNQTSVQTTPKQQQKMPRSQKSVGQKTHQKSYSTPLNGMEKQTERKQPNILLEKLTQHSAPVLDSQPSLVDNNDFFASHLKQILNIQPVKQEQPMQQVLNLLQKPSTDKPDPTKKYVLTAELRWVEASD